jgi:predicted nucleic acid-binding protein
MDVIVDANLLVGVVTQHPLRQTIHEQFNLWADQDVMLHAPDLAHSEVMNALTRMITAEQLVKEKVQAVCEALTRLPIQYHTVGFDFELIEMALRLGRKSAYDAVYLVLGQRLGADLWTMDSPLYRNATGHGYPVRLLENSK